MKYLVIPILFCLCTSFSSCIEEEPRVYPPPYIAPNLSVLDTVWTRSFCCSSTKPTLNKNGDLLVSAQFNNTGKGEAFLLLDKNTGALKWEWNDYIVPEEIFGIRTQIDDIMILSSGRRSYAFNIVTGQTVWKYTIDSIAATSQICKDEDGYIYKGFYSKTQPSTIYIFRSKYNIGNWELVCTYKDKNPIRGRFEPASIGVTKNAKGEKVVVFSIYTWYDKLEDNKALLVGYNLSTQTFDWEKNYRPNPLAEFSVFMFTNHKGIVYTFAAGYTQEWYLLAFDINTGNLLWQKLLPNFGTGIDFFKDNMIVSCANIPPNVSPVYCFNQKTGNLVWQQSFAQITEAQKSDLSFSFDESILFKNYHLSTQGKRLLALNADNGEIVFFDHTTLPEGYLNGGVAANDQKGVFYAVDGRRILCYKLPASIK
jgi:outer membrane protein assembly factor BamB